MSDLASLVIKLSADVATLQSDMQKAVGISNRAADQISAGFTKSLSAAGDVVKEFAGTLIAAFAVDKIVEVGRAVIDLGDHFNKLSQKVGVSVESLSALNNAAKLSDVGIDQLQTGLTKLAKNSADASAGGKETAAAFKAIGISVNDSAGALKPTQQLLEEVATKFASYADGAGKTAEAQRIFGKSGADLIPLLNQLGKDGFGAVTQAAKDYNQVIGGEQAKQSEEFNDNLTRLTMAGSGFANAIVKQMLPALVQYTNTMADASKTTNGYQDSAGVFANAAKGVVLALDFMAEGFKGLVSFVLALGDSLGAAGDLFNGFAVAAVHDVNAIGQVMRGNLTGAKAEMDQAGSSLSEGWEKASTRIKTAWAAADSGISAGQQSIEKSFQQLFGTFSNVVGGVGVVTEKLKQMPVPLKDGAEAADKAAQALEKLNTMMTKDAETMAKLRGEMDPLSKVQQDYVRTIIEAQKSYQDEMDLAEKAGASLQVYAQIKQTVIDKTQAAQNVYHKETAELLKNADVVGQYLSKVAKAQATLGMSDRQKQIADAVAEATEQWKKLTPAVQAYVVAMGSVDPTTAAGTKAITDAAAALFDATKQSADLTSLVDQFGQKSDYDQLIENIDKVGDAISKTWDPAKLLEYERVQDRLNNNLKDHNIALAQEGVASLQKFAKEGTAAYTALGIAQDILAYRSAIASIANQGSGDPYTAFARIAAMIALMASIGIRVAGGGSSAPAPESAAVRQASQGTGSVLGDATAQSESIKKATQITANATQQLVGLNRGMLTALQALQNALGAAGNQLARGAGNVPFAGPEDHSMNLAGPGSSDPVGGWLGSFLFGGKQSVIDQGILIAGGALNDMLNNIVVGAYQTIQTDGGLFGSDSTSDQLSDVSDAFSKQFQLVIKSIADTVREGALALGLLPADVEAAMASYQVAAQRISLQGLSAEDQQKALEAVFSQLFDGLAGAIVPFIGQFQQVGEGLGETLVRVATEVQVTQEGFKQLGLAVAQTDPEKFAQIADGMIQAAGGIDSFITGMNSFVKNFSDSTHQLDVSSAALVSAFSQVGLAVPSTRDGMWELMQSLDASTEAGQKQIATLLRLSDTSAAYYDSLDAFSKTLGLDGSSDFIKKLSSIRDAAVGLVTALSRAGASTETLRNVYTTAADKMQEVIDQLQQSAQDLAYSLGLTNTPGSQSAVEAEIARLQAKVSAGSDALGNYGNAITDVSQQANNAIQLLLGNLSNLNDAQKLEVARQGLVSGTVSQTDFLEIARRLFATSERYNTEFAFAQQYPGRPQASGGGSAGNGGVQAVGATAADAARLADLLKQDAVFKAADQLQKFQDLANQIAELASAKQESIQQAIDDLGIKNADLERGLGVASDDALKAYIETQQRQNDSSNENAGSIVQAIKDLPEQIANAIHPGTTNGSDGHSTGHNLSGPTADEIGDAVGRTIGRIIGPNSGQRANIRESANAR